MIYKLHLRGRVKIITKSKKKDNIKALAYSIFPGCDCFVVVSRVAVLSLQIQTMPSSHPVQ